MKKILDWQTMLGIILVILSAVVYYVHYLIFRDPHHIFIYLVGDIGFVFLEVLLVSLILHKLLVYREKQSVLKKLNMVIGTFFTEVGTELLKKCSLLDPNTSKVTEQLTVKADWSNKEFASVKKSINGYDFDIKCDKTGFKEIKEFLIRERSFLLDLMGNPNLLEHESFTDLLWAVFHLTDELAHRADISSLPDSDCQHIAGDIKRAYNLLVSEWLNYMEHLKYDYPYLFSMAIRTNPFNAAASIHVK